MKSHLGVFKVNMIPPDLVETYWQTLYVHDRLQYRMCDVLDPTWSDVKIMIGRHGDHMYMIYDVEQNCIVAEFMLENFTGKAAQVHFSMLPTNEKDTSIDLAKTTTDDILQDWKTIDGEPFLHTIYGLTPAPHRAALRFIQKAGFTKVGVLPSGMSFKGKIVDGVMTIKER